MMAQTDIRRGGFRGLRLLLCIGWLGQTFVIADTGGAVDVLFPAPEAEAKEQKAAVSKDALETVRETLEGMEERLQQIEERLGRRRLRPTVSTSVERRLEDIERRLTRIEQQLGQMRNLEQRIRRLETQRQ